MTVDLSKVKAGDKVRLEFVVAENAQGDLIFSMGTSNWFLNPKKWSGVGGGQNFEIVEHIPGPWVPAVGDRIKHKGSREPSIWAISCIDPDGDWVVKHVKSEYKSVVQTKGQYQFELDNS